MGAALSPQSAAQEQGVRPNVLFLAVDDLNDWLGCMGGHPQAKTPHLDQLAPPRIESLPRLAWHALGDERTAPASKPDGNAFDVVIVNRLKNPVRVYWMSTSGERKPYGEIVGGGRRSLRTKPGAVWLIADQDDAGLGYFRVGDRRCRAVVPR